MPNCPHCGEPYRKGQERCYACGQRVRARAVGRRSSVNPLVFIIAGAVVLVGVVGMIVLLPRAGREAARVRIEAEEKRVADSVREANRQRLQREGDEREVDRLNAAVADIADRYRRVKKQVVGSNPPTGEQTKLMNRIETEINQMRALVGRIDLASEETKGPLKDTLHAGRRRVQALISDLTRAPKNR